MRGHEWEAINRHVDLDFIVEAVNLFSVSPRCQWTVYVAFLSAVLPFPFFVMLLLPTFSIFNNKRRSNLNFIIRSMRRFCSMIVDSLHFYS